MHLKDNADINLLFTSAPKAPLIALYISEFRDVDVIPTGYNLTVVCIGNKSREGYLHEGQPFGVQLFFRGQSVKICGGGFRDKEDSKSCELRIEKVSRSNSGQYDCMVSNFATCSSAELTLSVRGEHLYKYRCISGVMKTVLISTQPPWHFLNQSITDSLLLNNVLTHLACVWLASCWPLRLQGMVGQSLSCKEKTSLTDKKSLSLWPILPLKG